MAKHLAPQLQNLRTFKELLGFRPGGLSQEIICPDFQYFWQIDAHFIHETHH